jgi:ABC-type uncharacterized transport system permease subunit
LKYDKPLIATIIGAASTITGEILTRVLLSLGIGKYSLYELISFIVTINRPSEIVGLIMSCIIGGVISVVFYYALEKLGQDYLILKGTFISLVFFALAEVIFTATIEGKYINIRPMEDYYIHIFAALGFGLTLGFLFEKYLFNPSLSSNAK